VGAAVAYALRRTSARVVLAFVLGGLVFVVYRAVHAEALGPTFCANFGGGESPCTIRPPMSTPWDLAVGAAAVAVALVVAAALWYERPVRR
jgi:hypothetical protein